EPLMIEFLEQRVKVSNQDARMLSALSGGSLARAITLRDLQPKLLRDQSLQLLEPALRGNAAGLLKAVQTVTRGRVGRETLRRLIEFQELWLRDLLRARYGAPRERLVNRDREAEIRRQADGID